jgi:hypothetical protein
LICGISSRVVSVILRTWGIRNLDTASPWDPRTTTTGTPPSVCCSSARQRRLSCTRPTKIQNSVRG